jgi:hypothetical protein
MPADVPDFTTPSHPILLYLEELTLIIAPDEVPAESRFLLDFDPYDLAEGDISKQERWILAMRAARIAVMRMGAQGR